MTERYRCRVCRRWFRPAAMPVSCCVIHGKGECCHFMETPVTKKGWPTKVQG